MKNDIPMGSKTYGADPWRVKLGWVLIGLAFIFPVVAAIGGKLDSFEVGELLGRAAGSLVFLAFIGWLCTRSLSELAKANGRIVVGLLLCSVVGSNIHSKLKERDELKTWLAGAFSLHQRQAEKYAELDVRLAKLPYGSVLTPKNLVTSSGIQSGKAVVAQLRALLAERDLLVQSHISEVENFINTIPSEQGRKGARESMNETMLPASKVYAELSRAQRDTADVTDAILDWAAQQTTGTMQAQRSQILFKETAQLEGYQALMAKLQAVAETEEKWAGQAVDLQNAGQERLKRVSAEVDAFIKN